MRLFSQSITAAVETMLLANGQGRTLVTLPSYDGPFMLAIAQRLVAVAKAHQARLELKIAFKTLQQWRQEDVQIARDNGWEDTRGNLTYYRNTLNEQEKTLVVLCGADKVTDTAGLEDLMRPSSGHGRAMPCSRTGSVCVSRPPGSRSRRTAACPGSTICSRPCACYRAEAYCRSATGWMP